MNSLLLEILNERHYAVSKSVFGGFRSNVMGFLSDRTSLRVEREKGMRSVAAVSAEGKLLTPASHLTDFRVMDDDGWDDMEAERKDSTVRYVNILALTGPMTRGGGACSYGSIDMRDKLIEAADRDDVTGHIIYCRTPGGSAATLLDFRKAIDYIHERGQKIYMFCDGTVASGGVFLSAMCDGVYAYNGDDEIGSIGMYSAFFALENGAKNAITQETYVEYYAEKSSDKNKCVRDAANGDMEELAEETDRYLDGLLEDMRADRPSITEEQMTGAMFRMKDVVGTMIDGICTLPELVERVYAGYMAEHPADGAQNGNDNNQNDNVMNKEYKNIALGAGYETGVVMTAGKDGFLTLQPQEADALEEYIASYIRLHETLAQENTSLKEGMSALSENLAAVTLERDNALNTVADLKKSLEEMTTAREALENVLRETAERNALAVAEKDQVIVDLQTRLEEAESGREHTIDAGDSPANNGPAAGASRMTSAPAWDPNLSPKENKDIMDAYLKEQEAKIGTGR